MTCLNVCGVGRETKNFYGTTDKRFSIMCKMSAQEIFLNFVDVGFECKPASNL